MRLNPHGETHPAFLKCEISGRPLKNNEVIDSGVWKPNRQKCLGLVSAIDLPCELEASTLLAASSVSPFVKMCLMGLFTQLR